MDQNIILVMLHEIRDDQKQMVKKLNDLTIEMEISRNGYTPHQVVELLHWVEDQKVKEERRNDHIKRAVIGWIVPTILSATIVGIFMLYQIK